jgi:hypothetical protein
MWKQKFNRVIDQLKIWQDDKADAYYYQLQKNIQLLTISIKENIIIPCAVPVHGTNIGDLYILQIPGWNYIYHYLTKYSNTSSLLYPKEVNYDYIYAYKELVDNIKDRYDYLELYIITYILYPLYVKWLLNYHNSDHLCRNTLFPNNFDIGHETTYYELILYNDLMNYIEKCKYNEKLLDHYLLIKHLLPPDINVLQFLLLN